MVMAAHFKACLLLLAVALPLVLSVTPLSVPFRGHTAYYRPSAADGDEVADDPGEPVYLSPYLANGDLDKGSILMVASIQYAA